MVKNKPIIDSLSRNKNEIKRLLIEIYPDCEEVINFHFLEDFKEWFAFLFEGMNWKLSKEENIYLKDINYSRRKYIEVSKEIKNPKEIKININNLPAITLVKYEGKYSIVDGYHRVFIAESQDIVKLKACVWEKTTNNHSNCKTIRDLIIKNL